MRRQKGEKILSLLTFNGSKKQDNTVNLNSIDGGFAPNRTLGSKSGITSPIGDKNSPFNRLNNQESQDNHIISGYFVKEKSYKEMVVARINNFLCGVLLMLVCVCLVSYYFVLNGEIQLNQIRKETLALNYDNEEMQNKLDNLQSYTNVDRQVTRTKILQRAKQVMELSAASIPNVKFENKNKEVNPSWSMGY